MANVRLAAEATVDELRETAENLYNLEVDKRWGRERLIEQFKLIGVDLTVEGAVIPLYQKAAPAPAVENGSVRMMKTNTGREEKHYCITVAVAEGEGGDRPVVTRVNGVNFLIPRGKPVWVPERYVEALQNAVRDVYEPTQNGLGEPRKVHSYPFSITAA